MPTRRPVRGRVRGVREADDVTVELRRDDGKPAGRARVARDGRFAIDADDPRIRRRQPRRPPAVAVTRNGTAISPEDLEIRVDRPGGLTIDLREPPLRDGRLRIDSLEDLRRHEVAVLRRIAGRPSGGALFLIDPWRLLTEVGVDVAESVRDELLTGVPTPERPGRDRDYELLASLDRPHRNVTIQRLLPEVP